MNLKQLVSKAQVPEEMASLSIRIPKSQLDGLCVLAEKLIQGDKRGKLSRLLRIIFKEVLEQNRSSL